MSKWSHHLTVSGFPARWNSRGKLVFYTAGSATLAALENIVHRSGEGLNAKFKLMLIEIPSRVKIKEIKKTEIPEKWFKIESYEECQKIGDKWVTQAKHAVLKVPSSIIRNEYNYLLNVDHSDMRWITLKSIEDFEFDPRIRPNDWL